MEIKIKKNYLDFFGLKISEYKNYLIKLIVFELVEN